MPSGEFGFGPSCRAGVGVLGVPRFGWCFTLDVSIGNLSCFSSSFMRQLVPLRMIVVLGCWILRLAFFFLKQRRETLLKYHFRGWNGPKSIFHMKIFYIVTRKLHKWIELLNWRQQCSKESNLKVLVKENHIILFLTIESNFFSLPGSKMFFYVPHANLPVVQFLQFSSPKKFFWVRSDGI